MLQTLLMDGKCDCFNYLNPTHVLTSLQSLIHLSVFCRDDNSRLLYIIPVLEYV
jgi:hypothetical protein